MCQRRVMGVRIPARVAEENAHGSAYGLMSKPRLSWRRATRQLKCTSGTSSNPHHQAVEFDHSQMIHVDWEETDNSESCPLEEINTRAIQ